MNANNNAIIVKKIATELGFSFCGIATARKLSEQEKILETWLSNGHNGKMNYMQNYFDLRLDPQLLVPGTKTIISLVYNYYQPMKNDDTKPKIAMYAQGEDYHKIVRKKLKIFLKKLEEKIGQIQGRCFVDSAPILERAWAQISGLGWIGNNSMLINPKLGSYFFLAEILVDFEASPDIALSKDYCGTCKACVQACPTQAILPNKVVDGSKCISYFTIELKENIPSESQLDLGNFLFGCDICQDVCPWNRFSKKHNEPAFETNEIIKNYKVKDWIEITNDIFNTQLNKSPLKRAGVEKLKKRAQDIFAKSKKSEA